MRAQDGALFFFMEICEDDGMATLYVVATPIGNLEDITLRALRVLQSVNAILCEDTRVTQKLLAKYEFDKPLISYHAQSKFAKTERIFELLARGKDLALVSDAGTPTISDPGCLLVAQVRERFGDEVAIVPIPGASAVLSALSVSGFPASEYLFLGFLPHKKGREKLFQEIAGSSRVVVFYESVHRIKKTLESLDTYLATGPRGAKRRIMIGRELTKLHEETFIGTPREAIAHYAARPDRLRGEFVVVVEGA